jgi:DNA-binding CsgD family transcriptional regulator
MIENPPHPQMPAAAVDEIIRSATVRFTLTPAEALELRSMLAGLECKESAQLLGLSGETVRHRRKLIYRKAGVACLGKVIARVLGLEQATTPLATASPIAHASPVAPPPTNPTTGD